MSQVLFYFRNALLVFALFLSGCASLILDNDLDNPPPPDFPKLTVVEHYVTQKEINDRCNNDGKYALIHACTEVDFERMVADIWFDKDSPPPKSLIKHELEHSRGHDHFGDSVIRDAWENFKRSKRGDLPDGRSP
ncbi:MAG: hypothetical protein A2942_03120 [Candidatus Lloydbacteria bacterium RIFCSPLOWO2_01_FULL_50_20]|uniref:Lipoprotein n=1 Tax=Candidatus Lloydbacteria bacterium RIFCSPLOWO2_01_FULL_50_20 TaxID=1798665 RepID=A0A1G2DHS6_9BACT|nr:MAG: hypothetical protein A3C13_04655 [Candidatus Lloydbacteria bacterium RIFCSPHIGHO2_02_FULL_50_11]OGZ13217.1 MAG: hypothetical protein A2942_03120 [Candidatus Lloydbacteria bacterium RIFCSPLOWO2_01_FULL_50_20]